MTESKSFLKRYIQASVHNSREKDYNEGNNKRTLIDIAVIIISGFIFSCGLKTFTAPNDIAPGGASGICVAVAHLTGLSEGVLYFIVNVPLML